MSHILKLGCFSINYIFTISIIKYSKVILPIRITDFILTF